VRGATLGNVRGLTAAGIAAAIALAALVTAVVVQVQPFVALAVPVVFATAFLCARRPAGTIAFVLVLSGSFGSLQAFGVGSPGPLVDLILAALWVSVLVSHLIKERDRPWWIWPGLALTCLYLLLTFLEITTAATLEVGLRSFRYSAWYMLVLPLLALAGWSLRTYVRISRALIAVALLVGGYAVVRLIIGPAASEETFALGGAGGYNIVDDKLALIGSFPSRHSLAFWATAAIPFCLAAVITQPRRWKLVAAAAAGLCTAAVLGTEVRAAIPALVAGVGTVILLYQLSGGLQAATIARTISATLIALTVGAAMFTMVVGESSARYDAILNPSGDISYEHRIAKWRQALEDIEDAPFGKGLGTAGLVQELDEGPYITQGSYGIDSSYLKIAYEQGFPVMILFIVAMLTLLVGLARRALQTLDRTARGIAIGGAGTLVAALSMFVTAVYIENLPVLTVWVAVGAGIGAIGAARSERTDAADEDDGDAVPKRVLSAPVPGATALR
jgi:O-Antigen ligase